MTEIFYDDQNKMDPVALRDLLTHNICTVTFQKVNGVLRDMPCTLRSDLLPAVQVTENTDKPERKQSDATLSVWCTDAAGWRSFRYDSVHKVVIHA